MNQDLINITKLYNNNNILKNLLMFINQNT